MKISRVGIVTITAAAVIWFGANAMISNADGVSSQPGSAEDPIVTKSYLDEQLSKLTGQTITTQAGVSNGGLSAEEVKRLVAAELDAWKKSNGASTTPSAGESSGSETASQSISVVQLQQGETLFAGAGAEVIVRTGKTVAVSTDENGIPDVTAGKDIMAGSAIELNHLLIFPREGRGIKPDPKQKSDINLMVRGSYMVMKP